MKNKTTSIITLFLILLLLSFHSEAQNWEWAKTIGGSINSSIKMQRDSLGNIYLTAGFQGAITLGGVAMNSGTAPSAFIAKLDSNGKAIWTKQFMNTNDFFQFFPSAIVINRLNHVFITGTIYKNSTIDGISLQAIDYDMIELRIDSSGAIIKSSVYGSYYYDGIHGADLDSLSNLYVGGEYEMESFLLGRNISTTGDLGGFIAKYDFAGPFTWVVNICPTNSCEVFDIKVVRGRNLIVTGSFKGSQTIGGQAMTSAGGFDGFIAQYDASGNPVWGKRFGSENDERESKLTKDKAGNYYLAATYYGSSKIENTNIQNISTLTSFFISKFDNANTLKWTINATSQTKTMLTDLKIDNNGNVLGAGIFSSNLTLGGFSLVNKGGDDIFIVRISKDGSIISLTGLGNANYESYVSIVPTSGDNFYLAGTFGKKLNVGNNQLTATNTTLSGSELFLARFNTAISPVITVSSDIITVTSINDNLNNEGEVLSIYPNPSQSQIHIPFTLTPGTNFELINVHGNIQNLELINNQLNVATLPRGKYILKVSSSNTHKIFSIILE